MEAKDVSRIRREPDYSDIEIGMSVDSYKALQNIKQASERGFLSKMALSFVSSWKNNSLDYTALKSLSLIYGGSKEDDDKWLTPEEIKVRFPYITNPEPMVHREAQFINETNKEKVLLEQEFGKELSWDTPISSSFAVLGMLAGGFGVGAITTAVALRHIGAGIGGGVMGATASLRSLERIGRMAKRFRDMQAAQKAAGMAQAAAHSRAFQVAAGMFKGASGKHLKYFGQVLAFDGTANVLEEYMVKGLEEELFKKPRPVDYKTLAVAFFAPVVLHALGKAVGFGFKKSGASETIGRAYRSIYKKHLDKAKGKTKERHVYAKAEAEKEFKEVFEDIKTEYKKYGEEVPPGANRPEYYNDLGKTVKMDIDVRGDVVPEATITQARSTQARLSRATKDPEAFIAKLKEDAKNKPELKKDKRWKEQIDQANVVKRLNELIGQEKVEVFLRHLIKDLNDTGFNIDLIKLFPFLKDMRSFDKYLHRFMKENKIKDSKGLKRVNPDDFFKATVGGMTDYMNKLVRPREAPTKVKQNYNDSGPPKVEPQKEIDVKVEENINSRNDLNRSVGAATKNIKNALKDYAKCLAGEVVE